MPRKHGEMQTTRRVFDLEKDLLEIVAKEFNLPVSAIASFTRGKTHEAAARHVVPYILHVVVGYSMTSAGACISRDRTSARYAITKTEDAREGKNKLLSQRIDNIEVEAIHLLLKYGMKLPS